MERRVRGWSVWELCSSTGSNLKDDLWRMNSQLDLKAEPERSSPQPEQISSFSSFTLIGPKGWLWLKWFTHEHRLEDLGHSAIAMTSISLFRFNISSDVHSNHPLWILLYILEMRVGSIVRRFVWKGRALTWHISILYVFEKEEHLVHIPFYLFSLPNFHCDSELELSFLLNGW